MLPGDADDEASFGALFDQHSRAVLAYCLRRTRTEADAEDVTAETFLVAWRRRRDIPENPRPWLYAVARRLLANLHRGTGRWVRLLERVRLHQEAGVQTGPSRGGPALAALTALSDDDQELLRLVAWEGLSHAEIAASLDITANAVAVRLHRARQRYAKAFAALGGKRLKDSRAVRTSRPVTGSSDGSWRHEDTR